MVTVSMKEEHLGTLALDFPITAAHYLGRTLYYGTPLKKT